MPDPARQRNGRDRRNGGRRRKRRLAPQTGRIKGKEMSEVTIKRALLSVSDKNGLGELGRALGRHGVELVSPGGTAKALREIGREAGRERVCPYGYISGVAGTLNKKTSKRDRR